MTLLDEAIETEVLETLEAETLDISYLQMVSDSRFSFLSYGLDYDFLGQYSIQDVEWGFKTNSGDSLSELTFITKYSRPLPDGTKEQWWQTCERVINGTVSILKDYYEKEGIKYQQSELDEYAHNAYDAMFHFKWLPPGRGLWSMGTYHTNGLGESSRLQNCAFMSTVNIADEFDSWFNDFMLICMAGVGIGFDTRGAKTIKVKSLVDTTSTVYIVEDSKEGWCNSTQRIVSAFFGDHTLPVFNYDMIRTKGAPISSGGMCPGPKPLIDLHGKLVEILTGNRGKALSSRMIVDLANLVGKAVVAGGIRRTATLALGEYNDDDFLSIKDWNLPENKERMAGEGGWGWTSNNSFFAEVGQDYSKAVNKIKVNGEPGLIWLDEMQNKGRTNSMAKGESRYDDATGGNPCLEQQLSHMECCTLVELVLPRIKDSAELKEVSELAFKYAKIVTLMDVPWEKSVEVMRKNRRIGCSMTGLAEFVEANSFETFVDYCDGAYRNLRDFDKVLSKRLGIPESIRITSIKPSGTVSLIAGCTPGVHWPVASEFYLRRVRYATHDPILPILKSAGYHIEPALGDTENTVVVTFPVNGPTIPSEREVSLKKKIQMATLAQQWWADNMVSATFTFLPEEASSIEMAIKNSEGKLKVMSFLPMGEETIYPQSPYEMIKRKTFDKISEKLTGLDMAQIYRVALDADQEGGCANDNCEIKS